MSDTTPTITARSGVLLVVCAPSGTGKTTLIQRLRAEFPNFAYSISCTTRAPRGHETDGKDYHFLSVEEFLRRREAGFFAEWANVHGNYYGTPTFRARPSCTFHSRAGNTSFSCRRP